MPGGNETVTDLVPRSTLAGKTLLHYRVIKLLGRGGMGEVWLAEDTRLKRQLALKMLKLPPSATPEDEERWRARFLREARVAAALSDPHIAAVYDVGEVKGQPFIAMELVLGRTLRDILRTRRSLAPEEVVSIGRGIAQALAKAHAAGIVHRDIKPENVMMLDDGGVKILDFGIARLLDDDVQLTGENLVAGTPAYTAPELMEGAPPSPAGDVWSAGIMLHELLIGWRPKESAAATTVVSSKPAPLAGDAEASQLRKEAPADTPDWLFDAIERCLARDLSRRPRDGTALLGVLAPEDHTTLATPSAPSLRAHAPGTMQPSSPSSPSSLSSPSAARAAQSAAASGEQQRSLITRVRVLPRAARLALVALPLALIVGAVVVVVVGPGRGGARGAPSIASVPIVSDDAKLQARWGAAVNAVYGDDVDGAAASLAQLRAEHVQDHRVEALAATLRPALPEHERATAPTPTTLREAAARVDAQERSARVVRMVADLLETGDSVDDAADFTAADALAAEDPADYFGNTLIDLALQSSRAAGTDVAGVRAASLKRLLEVDPGPARVWRAHIALLLSQGDVDGARRASDDALARRNRGGPTSDPLAPSLRASIAGASGDHAAAREAWAAALQLDPGDARAEAGLLEALLDEEDASSAGAADEARTVRHARLDALRAGALGTRAVRVLSLHAQQLAARGHAAEAEQLRQDALQRALAAQASSAVVDVLAGELLDGIATAEAAQLVHVVAEVDAQLARAGAAGAAAGTGTGASAGTGGDDAVKRRLQALRGLASAHAAALADGASGSDADADANADAGANASAHADANADAGANAGASAGAEALKNALAPLEKMEAVVDVGTSPFPLGKVADLALLRAAAARLRGDADAERTWLAEALRGEASPLVDALVALRRAELSGSANASELDGIARRCRVAVADAHVPCRTALVRAWIAAGDAIKARQLWPKPDAGDALAQKLKSIER